jgi:hypothetical protein
MLAPDLRHLRRCQAGNPLIGLSEFPEPPLPEHPGLKDAPGEGWIAKPYTGASIVAALRVVAERMSKLPALSAFPPGFALLRA